MVQRSWRLAVAESCTGGWLAKCLTDIAGSSAWFERGYVVYSNLAKTQMLGVPDALIQAHGAVSAAVARALVEGAQERSGADVAVALTGIAGPGGGTADKPVGLVWIAWKAGTESGFAREYRFTGDREAVRRAAVATALAGVRQLQGPVDGTSVG